jgi:hypothetical protein
MPESKNWGGARKGAGRPRKYRYIKMQFDSRSNQYVGELPNGDKVVVDADVFAEAEQAARKDGSKEDLNSPLVWENNQDGESVRVVKK